jgi:hypothetical protein
LPAKDSRPHDPATNEINNLRDHSPQHRRHILHHLARILQLGHQRAHKATQRFLMLHIESEEEVMALLFGVGHETNMTSARFICRKTFSEGEKARRMPRSRAGVDVDQTHRFPEFLQAPRQSNQDSLRAASAIKSPSPSTSANASE